MWCYHEEDAIKLLKKGRPFSSKEFDLWRDNKNVALIAIEKNPFAIKEISERLKDDEQIAIKAIGIYGNTYEYLSERLKNKREIVIKALEHPGEIVKFLPQKFYKDREIILKCIQKNGDILKHVYENFKNDEEIVWEAVRQKKTSIQYVGKKFLNNKELFLFALKNLEKNNNLSYGYILDIADETLKDDIEIVYHAIKYDNWNFRFTLKYASQRIQKLVENKSHEETCDYFKLLITSQQLKEQLTNELQKTELKPRMKI